MSYDKKFWIESQVITSTAPTDPIPSRKYMYLVLAMYEPDKKTPVMIFQEEREKEPSRNLAMTWLLRHAYMGGMACGTAIFNNEVIFYVGEVFEETEQEMLEMIDKNFDHFCGVASCIVNLRSKEEQFKRGNKK